MHFRLLSYNIHKGIGGVDRRYDLGRIVDTISECQPDVAFLQEVDDGVPRSRQHAQAELLAAKTGLEHFTYQRNVRLRVGHYGNAILSRFPLEDPKHIDLTVRPKKRRGALIARWRVPVGDYTKTMMLVNLHIGLSGIERQWQLKRLFRLSHLAELRNRMPLVIGGDFNDFWNTLGWRVMEPAGFSATGPAIRTFPARLPLRPLDKVFFRGDLRPLKAYANQTETARAASDHLPLVVDFEFTRPEPMHLRAFAFEDQIQYWLPNSTTSMLLFINFCVQVAIGVRVIMQRRPTGETLAWIMVVFSMPFVGPTLYLVLGELRLGRRRAGRFTELTKPLMSWLHDIRERSLIDWNALEADYKPLAEMCERTIGVPALAGNRVDLLDDWQPIFKRLLADIEAATSTIHIEFYIWSDGGEADEIADALIHAERRGVTCRVLVDALGSHRFLRGKMCQRLREGGVQVVAALPGGLFRLPFVRFDLRLHRKIVVIDGRIGYTGSLNLVDPRYFKKDAGVGEWIDAMVRLEGPAVEAMQIIFLADWYVESHAELHSLLETADAKPQPSRGDVETQVMPSGPDLPANAIEQVLLTAIYSARHELLITTPYFVPSEPLMLALVSAARRGVKVVLILPRRVDSKLVRFASSAFKGELLEAGVRIALFNDGLLHTKSVTVDRTHSLFGSVNLDPRSFRLNFEILLAMYDSKFTAQLADLQQKYIDRSELMDLEAYRNRGWGLKIVESFARLLGPLL